MRETVSHTIATDHATVMRFSHRRVAPLEHLSMPHTMPGPCKRGRSCSRLCSKPMKDLKAQRCVRATACPPCSYCCLKVGVLLRAETMAMLCNYVICQAAQFVGKLLKVPSISHPCEPTSGSTQSWARMLPREALMTRVPGLTVTLKRTSSMAASRRGGAAADS